MPDGADYDSTFILAIILVPFVDIFMVRSILDPAKFIQVDKVIFFISQQVLLAMRLIPWCNGKGSGPERFLPG